MFGWLFVVTRSLAGACLQCHRWSSRQANQAEQQQWKWGRTEKEAGRISHKNHTYSDQLSIQNQSGAFLKLSYFLVLHQWIIFFTILYFITQTRNAVCNGIEVN